MLAAVSIRTIRANGFPAFWIFVTIYQMGGLHRNSICKINDVDWSYNSTQ